MKLTLLRLPAALLLLVCALAVSRSGDQVHALFQRTSFPSGYLNLYGIVVISGLAVSALVRRPTACWVAVDGILLALPIGLLGWAAQELDLASCAVTLIALIATLPIYVRAASIRGNSRPLRHDAGQLSECPPDRRTPQNRRLISDLSRSERLILHRLRRQTRTNASVADLSSLFEFETLTHQVVREGWRLRFRRLADAQVCGRAGFR